MHSRSPILRNYSLPWRNYFGLDKVNYVVTFVSDIVDKIFGFEIDIIPVMPINKKPPQDPSNACDPRQQKANLSSESSNGIQRLSEHALE